MKKSLYILILCSFAATGFAAKVTEVGLAYKNGETIARIGVTGQIRFTHQTEIPKDGKPDRVIVDVLSATHELGAKLFDNLPSCPITAIRTSQYSVKPEAVVRLVFDLKKTPVYQVETEGQSIVVHFIDKSATAFSAWSSVAPAESAPLPSPVTAVAPHPTTVTTPTQKNISAESDRQSSLAATPLKTPTPAAVAGKSVTAPATATPAKSPVAAPQVTPNPTPTAAHVTPAESKPVVAATPKPTVVGSMPPKPVTPGAEPPANGEVKHDVVWTPPSAAKPATPTVSTKPTTAASPSTSSSSTPAVKIESKPVDAKPSVNVSAQAPVPTAKAVPTDKPSAAVTITQTPVATSPAPVTVKPDVKPAVAKPVVPSPATSPTPKVETPSHPVPAVAVNPSTVSPIATPKPAPITAPVSSPSTEAKPQVATSSTPEPKPTSPTASPATPTAKSPTSEAVQTPSAKPSASTPVAEAKSEPLKPSEIAAKAKEATKPRPTTPKPYTDSDEDIPSPEDLEPAEDNPYVDHDSPAGVQWNENQAVDSNSTARFRRHPLTAAKIKGTMIAQFPQRLVIKYQSNGVRDPFATLIDDTKTFNTPTKQGVPNIDGMRLVGVIVARQGGNRALFIDKNGYTYMLQSGDKVRNGYVLRIESDRAYFQIFEYGWSRTVALKIDES